MAVATLSCSTCGYQADAPPAYVGVQVACPRCQRPALVAASPSGRFRQEAPGQSLANARDASSPPSGGEPPELRALIEAARRDPSRRLDRFLLLSELGRGGMGAVHKAWAEKLRRLVALKTLLQTADPGAARRFQREAEITARLRHPGIVALHDAGVTQGQHWMAVELVDGASFEARLEGEPRIALTRALEVLRDAARAVDHAHAQGVVHRDLKPANILVDARGGAHVLDFGVARREEEDQKLTKTGAIVGTVSYMAPEQVDGKNVDRRADVYSLGAILYVVLAGRPPFEGDSSIAVLTAVVSSDPIPPGALNRRAAGDLETICLKALEKEPARRYATAAALADDLERYLSGDPVEARPIGFLSRTWRRARRNKLATAGLLFLTASLVALAGGGVWLAGAGARARLAFARASAERAVQDFERERAASGGDERARADRLTGAGIAALGETRRLAELDPAERPRAFATAAAVGSEALALGQWSVARIAFATARDLEVDRPRAEALLATVEEARTRLADEHRRTVDGLLAEARLDATTRRNDWRTRALFGLVRIGDAATVERLAATVDAAQKKVASGLSLETGEQAALLLACDALGWVGVRERAVESLSRVLDTELARDAAGEDRAIAAGIALCRLGEGTRVEAAVARLRGRVRLQVSPFLGESTVNEAEATTAEELARRGVLRQTRGDFAGAVADLSRSIELAPNAASTWNNRGLAKKDLRDLDGAIADFTKALELDPRDASAWNHRAVARKAKGDLDGAIADYGKAIELSPKSPTAWHNRGDARRVRGDLDGAIEDCTKALEFDDRSTGAWTERGRAREAQGDLDGAIADHTRALELDPRYAAAWNNRGVARRTKGDVDGALADFAKAIELDPRDAAAWTNRGLLLQGRGDLAGARADHGKAIEVDPDYTAAWVNRGTVRQLQGDLDGAIADQTRAIELDRYQAPAWANRGGVRKSKGDLDGALADLTKAVEIDPRLAGAWVNRGAVYHAKGDLPRALADLTKAIELAPRNAIAWTRRGLVRAAQKDLTGAFADYTKALELDPRLVAAWTNRGTVRQLRLDLDGAIEDHSRAIAVDPREPTAWRNRGNARKARGDIPGALSDYKRFLELAPNDPIVPALRAEIARLEGK